MALQSVLKWINADDLYLETASKLKIAICCLVSALAELLVEGADNIVAAMAFYYAWKITNVFIEK